MTDFAATKALFHIPDGITYLDGNSLGPLPKAAVKNMTTTLQNEWGDMLITAWNKAGWMDKSIALGDKIGRLVGGEPNHIICGDTLSIKVYQALASALELNPDRRRILSDRGNFPTDLYMAEGLIKSLGKGHELHCVAPEDVENHISDDLAVLMLTEVDYRTGRKHDMVALTKAAHAVGALVIWDLAHSAGAFPVDLAGAKADFATGCTYKYLNAGPGAPAFIYVAPKHIESIRPALSGWLGHEAPFAFNLEYRAGPGITRMRVGTPPILQMSVLETALEIWDDINMNDVRVASIALTEHFIERVEATCPMLELASPRDANARGSQVSFRFEHGYPAMQALIDQGVIGDFRAPDIMRFGFTPLYIDKADVDHAVSILTDIMQNTLWDQPKYHARAGVT